MKTFHDKTLLTICILHTRNGHTRNGIEGADGWWKPVFCAFIYHIITLCTRTQTTLIPRHFSTFGQINQKAFECSGARERARWIGKSLATFNFSCRLNFDWLLSLHNTQCAQSSPANEYVNILLLRLQSSDGMPKHSTKPEFQPVNTLCVRCVRIDSARKSNEPPTQILVWNLVKSLNKHFTTFYNGIRSINRNVLANRSRWMIFGSKIHLHHGKKTGIFNAILNYEQYEFQC